MASIITWMQKFKQDGLRSKIPPAQQAEIDQYFLDNCRHVIDCYPDAHQSTALDAIAGLPSSMHELVSATQTPASSKPESSPSSEALAGVYAYQLSKKNSATIHSDLRSYLETFRQLGAVFNQNEAFRVALYLRDHEAKRSTA